MGNRDENGLLRVAGAQRGCLRRNQARGFGLSDRAISRRVASGRWFAVFPAVFRVNGAPVTWRQRLSALVLWGERGCALSHRAAAALHGLARFREGPLELTLTRATRAPPGCVTHRTWALGRREVVNIDDLPVTSIERTLVDLCSCETPQTVRGAVDEALRRKLTSLEALKAAVKRSRSQRGIRVLRAIVDELSGGRAPTESEFETVVAELLDMGGFPQPIAQEPVMVGGKLRRLDFRLPNTPVVIECDGYAFHSSPADFERDRQRTNALIARGYKPLRWTWRLVHDEPQRLLKQLEQTIRAL
jgi:hypothetical protein